MNKSTSQAESLAEVRRDLLAAAGNCRKVARQIRRDLGEERDESLILPLYRAAREIEGVERRCRG